MRNAFARTLVEVAQEHPQVYLLTGDLGFSVLEPFASAFPDRFINVGVAEQNMIGIAAGIAMGGNTVFVYSIANFPTLRCLEQIRNDVCYHQADVKVVAVGAGTAYGAQGYTHHGIEDLGILQALPYLRLFAPADPVETKLATWNMATVPGPAYLRLEKNGEPIIHETPPSFYQPGTALTIRAGNDIAFLCLGGLTNTARIAAQTLSEQGIEARVLSLHTLRPFDEAAVLRAARETRHLICVEEHRTPAPLLQKVATLLMREGLGGTCRLSGANLGDAIAQVARGQAAYRAQCGLDSAGLVATAQRVLAPTL